MEPQEYLAEAHKLDEDTLTKGRLSTVVRVFETLDEMTDSGSFEKMVSEAGLDDKGERTWKFVEALAEKDNRMAGEIAHAGLGYWLGVLRTELLRQEILNKAKDQ